MVTMSKPDEQQVRRLLGEIPDPELGRSLTELNMVRSVSAAGSEVSIVIAVTVPGCPLKDKIKSDIVRRDEREKGLRRVLNFGHTLGHAIEAASGYSFSHGDSVAIGMIAAARLSEQVSSLDRDELHRIEQLIFALSLKRHIPSEISTDAILSMSRQDKNKQGNTIYFVMLRRIGEPFVAECVAKELLRETIEGLRA